MAESIQKLVGTTEERASQLITHMKERDGTEESLAKIHSHKNDIATVFAIAQTNAKNQLKHKGERERAALSRRLGFRMTNKN